MILWQKSCLQEFPSDLKEDWYVNTKIGTFFEERAVTQMQWTQSFSGISNLACEN